MKITLSWYVSERENHTSTWEVDYANMWPIREAIDEMLELRRLRIENVALKKTIEAK